MKVSWTDRYPQLGEKLKRFYEGRGFGGRVGYGTAPAIIVIDFFLAETDKTGESPIGCDLDEAIENTLKILRVARKMQPKPPIIYTTDCYDPSFTDVAPALIRKTPLRKLLVKGSKWIELDPRIEAERQPDEPIIAKKHYSCFWGTSLTEILIGNRVDTLIITGCTTDSCVRATAIDSMDRGFNTIVPFEAVGSRDPEAAGYALLDIDLKYGDVVSTQEVIDYLEGLGK
jgi:nicotinamidase-related amidase